jgi:two-component system chemotaxis response regulator CheB
MTGMGSDGLIGVRKLHERNMTIIAQDPETCIVSGMPSSVIESGLASLILPPEKIGDLLVDWCHE